MYLCHNLMRVPVLRGFNSARLHQFSRFHLCCVHFYPRQIRNRPDFFQQHETTPNISSFLKHEPEVSSSNASDQLNPVVLKCREILQNLPEKKIEGNDEVEYIFRTKFGQVRFDADNVPSKIEPDDRIFKRSLTKSNHLPIEEPVNEIDEQYFKATDQDPNSNYCENNKNTLRNDHTFGTLNEIDEQYFGGVNYKQRSVNNDEKNAFVSSMTLTEESKMNFDSTAVNNSSEILDHKMQLENYHPPSKQDLNLETNLNYIDEVFFKDANASEHNDLASIAPVIETMSKPNLRDNSSESSGIVHDRNPLTDFERSLLDEDDEQCNFTPDPRHELTPWSAQLGQSLVDTYKKTTTKPKKVESVDTSVNAEENIVLTPHKVSDSSEKTDFVSGSKEKLFKVVPPKSDKSGETASTAFDYVLELRRKKKQEALQETAQDGSVYVPRYKNIIASVWSLEHRTKKEIATMLKDCIIYDQHGVVALYKPYGLRMHGGGDSGGRQHTPTLQDILPQLCRIMGADQLHHVHRLDVTTTGVLLLARTEDVAIKLRKLFQDRKIVKNYLAITKSSPSVLQGVIDIPLKEAIVDGKQRMVLRPVIEGSNQRGEPGIRAVTKFKVLSRLDSAALIYAQPLTGVKHQIRAHLGLGLSCPVLADHKYSSYTKIVPQRLNADVLHKLDLRQSRVRDLPMMLHASSVFLPQFVDNKNVKISCPPPPHFTKTMKALRLNSTKNVTDAKTLDFVDLGTEMV